MQFLLGIWTTLTAQPLLDGIITLLQVLLGVVVALSFAPVLIWLERKGSAYIQDRPGPNRAAVGPLRLFGLLHVVADAIKLFTKEDVEPAGAKRLFYWLAPMIVVAIGFTNFSIVPWFGAMDFRPWGGPFIHGAAFDIDAGLLWFFAVASLTVYGVIFAGWSSNSKYSLLGAMRASAAVLSYEIPLGLSVVGALMLYGTANLGQIVQWQGTHSWGIFYQPLGFILFIVCAFAEINRVPFDLAESESELVAGYHTEYTGMKFGMFFLAEYLALVVSACMLTTLFLGGWQVPFMSTAFLAEHAQVILAWSFGITFAATLAITAVLLTHWQAGLGAWGDWRDHEPAILAFLVLGGGVTALALLFGVMAVELPAWFGVAFAGVAQFHMFLAKVGFICWVFVWVRWTLPRFRYDQVMNLGWRSLLPLALANILVTGVAITVLNP